MQAHDNSDQHQSGFSGAQIIQALGTRAGSSQQGLAHLYPGLPLGLEAPVMTPNGVNFLFLFFSHLYSNAASEPLPQTDALTELDSTFALSSSEPEAAAQPALLMTAQHATNRFRQC